MLSKMHDQIVAADEVLSTKIAVQQTDWSSNLDCGERVLYEMA